MEVRFLGHASILLKTGRVTVVTDPWFSRSGAFLWSWFQFPDNTDLDLTEVREADYIVLSHEHQDHYDIPFLQTLSPKTTILIPQYTDPYLRDTLRAAVPNEVVVCPTMQPVELEDVTFWPVVQSVPFWDDCTLIFETPSGVIVDLNDMKLGAADAEWISNRFPNPWLLFAQYSGATYYPYAYEIPESAKVEIARNRIRSKFHGVSRLLELLHPRLLVPCAGPACFLDPELFELNFSASSIFPSQKEFHEFALEEGFADRVAVMLPGDRLDPDASPAAVNAKALQHPAFTDRRAYLEDYQARRLEIIRDGMASLPDYEGSLVQPMQEFLEPLLASSPWFRRKIDGAVLFDLSGPHPERIIVDFRRVTGACAPFVDQPYFYRFTLDGRILAMYLRGELHFDQLLLSLRFRARREPDIFNEFLFMFLRFADPHSYEQIQRYDEQRAFEERFELETAGDRYSVQRYCPHAMGDLSKGEVVDGCLVCPNHGWRFRLETGEAIGRNESIRIDRIDRIDRLDRLDR